MRYPQFFTTLAIEKRLDAGAKNGIIWHTQGSGKTALAFHNVRYLRDYYQKQGKIAKFYSIVDRLDLLTQASEEFAARGLHVEKVNSKDDFIKNIRTIGTANNSGEDTITVVNIQKFSTESIARKSDYDVNVQCQRRSKNVIKRRRSFVILWRRRGQKTRRFLAQKECSRFVASGA